MRHEKIVPTVDVAVDMSLTLSDAGVESLGEDAEKAPPVAQQHFWYCGRTSARGKLPSGRH